eukprot:991917_1
MAKKTCGGEELESAHMDVEDATGSQSLKHSSSSRAHHVSPPRPHQGSSSRSHNRSSSRSRRRLAQDRSRSPSRHNDNTRNDRSRSRKARRKFRGPKRQELGTCFIPAHTKQHVIGKKGENIQMIENQTGCKIRIAKCSS